MDTDAYRALEAAYKKIYNVITMPVMSTGATDMAFLRAKGMQCYGVGAMVGQEEGARGFGAFAGLHPLGDGRLLAAGFGEFQPIDVNENDEAYRRNRRIEMKLTER